MENEFKKNDLQLIYVFVIKRLYQNQYSDLARYRT